MPLYQYRCKKCKRSLEILRQFAEFDVPPQAEEVATNDPSLPECPEHEWERLIGGNQSIVKGWNWGGGKGNW